MSDIGQYVTLDNIWPLRHCSVWGRSKVGCFSFSFCVSLYLLWFSRDSHGLVELELPVSQVVEVKTPTIPLSYVVLIVGCSTLASEMCVCVKGNIGFKCFFRNKIIDTHW